MVPKAGNCRSLLSVITVMTIDTARCVGSRKIASQQRREFGTWHPLSFWGFHVEGWRGVDFHVSLSPTRYSLSLMVGLQSVNLHITIYLDFALKSTRRRASSQRVANRVTSPSWNATNDHDTHEMRARYYRRECKIHTHGEPRCAMVWISSVGVQSCQRGVSVYSP